MESLQTSYLFNEINRRKQEFLKSHPNAQLISLGVGDTTQPLPLSIGEAMMQQAQALTTDEGYRGYGPEKGFQSLRKQIASKLYSNIVHSDDLFISDGAKCDIGRLQVLFGSNVSVAIQDPAYPVYVDGSFIQGVKNITFMPCLPENDFFPDLSKLPSVDLIYFCSPNNPTGAVSTYQQLKQLVAYAHKHRTLILYDSAYASFIQDPKLPKTIYQIPTADEVAIEIGSFSKLAGFAGIRLGWSVVPEKLKYQSGLSIKSDWMRVMSTLFNGASILSQAGGLAVLEKKNRSDIEQILTLYRKNTALLKSALQDKGYQVFGGDHTPYLWVYFPGRKSWDVFQELLEKKHLITTPGSEFGPSGEGFIRFSAFGHPDVMIQAAERLKS